MDQERIKRLRRAMRAAKLDALVLRLPENLVMAFGVWPLNGFTHGLFTAADGPVLLIAPSCENEEMGGAWARATEWFMWPRLGMGDPRAAIHQALSKAARNGRLTRGRIGYEGSFEAVAPAHNAGEVLVPCEGSIAWLKSIVPSARWIDATDLIHAQRALKTEGEIERLRLAHRVADLGLKRFHQVVQPGASEADVAGAVYTECLARGTRLKSVRHVNVFPQVSSGPNAHRAWRPIVSTGKRRLRDGEMALLELAVCVDGFWADVTRVRVAGRPSTIQEAAFHAVVAAQKAAIDCMKAGVRASWPHEAATDVLRQAGFGEDVVHLTGHGIGFRYHEPEPFLMPGNAQRLKAGHVCSVEPGLYNRAWGGIRIEDNVVVRREGVEVLTHAPKRLT
ncbi:MAG: aminopeptidase P family protein [Pirellulales bacterium]|nr:aminopeptidase P family protein [Pirellulales bacterium]